MSRTLLAGRMQPESRSVCVFLPTREQLSLAVGVSGQEGSREVCRPGWPVLPCSFCERPLFSQKPGAGLLTERLLASLG